MKYIFELNTDITHKLKNHQLFESQKLNHIPSHPRNFSTFAGPYWYRFSKKPLYYTVLVEITIGVFVHSARSHRPLDRPRTHTCGAKKTFFCFRPHTDFYLFLSPNVFLLGPFSVSGGNRRTSVFFTKSTISYA
jgi:hypothetical protein